MLIFLYLTSIGGFSTVYWYFKFRMTIIGKREDFIAEHLYYTGYFAISKIFSYLNTIKGCLDMSN